MPTFIDAFAGAGGLSLGMRYAGFESLYSFDVDSWSCETYRRNLGGLIECRAVEGLRPEELLSRVGEPDVVVGGPPCQGFSTQRRGLARDARNDLGTKYVSFALAM